MMSANEYIKAMKDLISKTTDDNADESIDKFNNLLDSHPEIARYTTSTEVDSLHEIDGDRIYQNGYAHGYCYYWDAVMSNQFLPALTKDIRKDNIDRIKDDRKHSWISSSDAPALRKKLFKENNREIADCKSILNALEAPIANHRKYVQDNDTYNSVTGESLVKGYTKKQFANWLYKPILQAKLYSTKQSSSVDWKMAIIIVGHVISGLYDLKNEAYRETHDTIPADTRDYQKISNAINYSIKNYEAEVKALKQYRPAKVNKKTISPFGYADSAGSKAKDGKAHRFGKPELRKAVREIKQNAPVLQMCLF